MANRTVSVNLVANVGQYVSGMNAAAGATMRLGQTTSAATKQAKSGFDLASKGALLMGAAVVGGMALAVSKSMQFEKAMSAAAAATRASGAALADLRDAAMKAGADTQYSATEAAQAITEMGKAGVSTADILDGGLNGALSLAAAGQLDVAKAAEIASVAMTQFKLSGDQIPHVADLLAAGAGKAMGSVEDLGMALNQAGLVASSTGLSIEETTGSLAAFASAGLVGSDAGTSLRSMLLHLQNATGPAAATMEEYGISLYDAAGQFVGMESLAGQLQAKLGGLTQETRDAAMAQIFGSDAVRAANVLYAEGSDGIAEWTAKVNDQGYAAEQAAKLNDNLSGDLEKLGGAFETLMIAMGTGAQGPLRSLVQGLTDVLDGVMSLGAPLSALGGFIADNKAMALGLATALAVQLVGGIGAVNLALGRFVVTPALIGLGGLLNASVLLGPALRTAATAVGTFAAAAAPLVAVGSIVYAVTKVVDFATAAGDAREEIDGMWESVEDAGGGLEQLEAMGSVIDGLKDKIRSLKDELPKTEGAGQGFLAPLGMLENGGTIQALDEYEGALERAKSKQAEVADTARILGNQFGLTRDQVIDLATKYNVDLTVGTQNAYLQFQRFYNTEYGAGPTTATQQFTTSIEDTRTALDEAQQAIDDYKLSLDILTGSHVSMLEVEASLQGALAAGKDAMTELGGATLQANGQLNLASENGRTASDVLLGVRDSGNQLIATMIEQGATTEEVQAKDAQLREGFINTAMQMGISREAAQVLADQILGIPSERETKISADTGQAKAAVAALQAQIDGLRGRTVDIVARAIMPDLNGSVSGSGRMGTFAEGGFTGPGGKYQPAGIVHAGEIVWSQDDIRAHGGIAEVESMRRSRSGYAEGGVVGAPLSIKAELNARAYDSQMNALAKRVIDKYEPVQGLIGALQFARKQVGRPYIWGGVGPAGYDCSGFMSAITNVARGRSPHSRVGSTASFPWGGFASGYGSYTIGSTPNAGGGIGHMAGTLLGVNVESTGGVGVKVGGSARGASNGLFGTRAHLAMYGGGVIGEPVIGRGLRSGNSYSFGERGPETVLPGVRSREFSGSGGANGVVVKVAAPNLSGMKLTGSVAFDPSGILRFVDAVIVDTLQATTSRSGYNP